MSVSRILQILAMFAVFAHLFSYSAFAAAPKITSFSPATATIGNMIIIKGSGFTGATSVKFNGVAASSFSVQSATSIKAVVPTTGSTGKISVKTSGGTSTSSATFTMAPGVVLSVSSGHPYQKVTVNGAGFHAYTSLDLYFDTADQALATSDAKGVVTAQFSVPASAAFGSHWVTLQERGTFRAAQKSFSVYTNWTMEGFSVQGNSFNPYERTLTVDNVSDLVPLWSAHIDDFSNDAPVSEYAGNYYVVDVTGGINAFSSSGALLWSASPGAGSIPANRLLIYGGMVYYGGNDGVLRVYSVKCRTDGGVCSPSWSQKVANSITSAPRVRGATVYVPAADGNFYPVDATTHTVGAAVTYDSNAQGQINSPISFDQAGNSAYATAQYIHFHRASNNSSGSYSLPGNISDPVMVDNSIYVTTSAGTIQSWSGRTWSSPTSGTNCQQTPVVSQGLVFAGGCTTLAAYSASDGTLRWSVSANYTAGFAVANGIVFSCTYKSGGFVGALKAYAASSGNLLWSGGSCAGAPIVANGMVASSVDSLIVYGLPSMLNGANQKKAVDAPDPKTLKPNHSLSRQVVRPADIAAAVAQVE
ncbi:outer membrane protein assembly factor BamB family protein [Oryzibacter oryziterrae]|uniref:outer membrane protein assembly factor BamB family protein n=1 Tax=Oryzibacter oryziterrae TaxID=2766474 RepID=UPI001F166107|nr:PQQ-binding-like beta-propeller repeat protein [Oryzibacter oryziterrae]